MEAIRLKPIEWSTEALGVHTGRIGSAKVATIYVSHAAEAPGRPISLLVRAFGLKIERHYATHAAAKAAAPDEIMRLIVSLVDD